MYFHPCRALPGVPTDVSLQSGASMDVHTCDAAYILWARELTQKWHCHLVWRIVTPKYCVVEYFFWFFSITGYLVLGAFGKRQKNCAWSAYRNRRIARATGRAI
jgi:hypothetical protein